MENKIALEEISQTGIFSSTQQRGLSRQFAPFNEHIAVDCLAKELNSEGLSVQEAYLDFWTYTESKEIWGLPQTRSWRSILPDWRPMILSLAPLVDSRVAEEVLYALVGSFSDYRGSECRYDLFPNCECSLFHLDLQAKEIFEFGRVSNPFTEDFKLACGFLRDADISPGQLGKFADIISGTLHRCHDRKFLTEICESIFSTRREELLVPLEDFAHLYTIPPPANQESWDLDNGKSPATPRFREYSSRNPSYFYFKAMVSSRWDRPLPIVLRYFGKRGYWSDLSKNDILLPENLSLVQKIALLRIGSEFAPSVRSEFQPKGLNPHPKEVILDGL